MQVGKKMRIKEEKKITNYIKSCLDINYKDWGWPIAFSNIHVVMIVIGVISVEQGGKVLTGIDLQKNVKKVFGDSE